MSAIARTFKHFVRVPYAHTDQMGFVYYANYLIYFEMARSEMLREVGLPYANLKNRGFFCRCWKRIANINPRHTLTTGLKFPPNAELRESACGLTT